MAENLYFQDFPVSDYEDDYVGFEAEVEMLKEGVESDSKIIGLISEYGSGKSSIIELLRKSLDTSKYDIVNINLLDPDGNNTDFEAHKRMVMQLANHIYSEDKDSKKLSYITKRLNPNYKSIDISTTNNTSLFLIMTSVFFFIVKFLYSNGILSYINFLPHSKYQDIINVIKLVCNLSGLISFISLFIAVIKSEVIFNYLKNGDNQVLNEFDLIEISKRLIDNEKIMVIIIEDLDRLKETKYIEEFIKEINIYYKSMNNCKFIIAMTPKDFYNMSSNKTSKTIVDNKYKPFNMVIELPNIKNTDYEVILNNLLLSKKEILKKTLDIDIDKTLGNFVWLSFGKNMNIRRLKHRVNNVIHLYKTLITRFPNKYIEIKTCIAVVYLKDEYEESYEELVNNLQNKFILKQLVEKFIQKTEAGDLSKEIYYDLYKLVKTGYIDYNCEIYCFNYSKYNKIFDVDEYELVNSLMYDRKIVLSDLKVEKIIENNPNIIKEILDKRLSLNMGFPLNVFDVKPLINYFYNNEYMIKTMYEELLQIDNNHIKTTINRIKKIKQTDFFKTDNLTKYIKAGSEKLKEDDNFEGIEQIRLNLLDVIENPLILKELYEDAYSLITKEEMEKIGNLSNTINLFNYNKINPNNISYIVEMIDELYKTTENEKIIEISDKLPDEVIDYYFKNCKSLSNLNKTDKENLLTKNINKFNLNYINEIKKIITNVNYSIAEFENKVINLLTSGHINLSEYSDFVNTLPNVHINTLERIEKDDFTFRITDIILNEFESNKKYYGYIKFKTINNGIIPNGNKKYYNQYEKLYQSYYNSLNLAKNNNLHSISFPLISSGTYAGTLKNPSLKSAEKCIEAYNDFIDKNKDYEINVLLCAYTSKAYDEIKDLKI